jgi:hypothetical protein
MSDIVIGADPEIFVEHSDGKLFPAFEFLPSKLEPLKTSEGQSVYWDGFQAEFTVKPSANLSEVIHSIKSGLATVLTAARAKDTTARLSTKTVFETPIDYLKGFAPEYREFGCMPSYNVYELKADNHDGDKCPFRFAGGHIHFGCGTLSKEQISNTVKRLDYILALNCVALFKNYDQAIRRKFYGLPGEFRLPDHGLEYRTLSNAWLFHPKIAAIVLETAQDIMTRKDKPIKFAEKTTINHLLNNTLTSVNDTIEPMENYVDMKTIEENWQL